MFYPNHIFNNITEITSEFLESNNIKGLLLDVDNTLTTEHKSKVLRDGVGEWICKMKESGVALIILSNAKTDRAKVFAHAIGLDAIGMAAKPLIHGYFKAAKKLGLKRKQIAMVGDQIFTDTLGGKLSGIKTILVTDITPESSMSFRIRRKLEKKILKKGVK